MKLLKLLHIHYFKTPIRSKYVSFLTRDITYKCRCGKEKVYRVTKAFGEPFPIKTDI